MTPEELRAIRERCEAATPGPWFVHESDRPGDYWIVTANAESPFEDEVFDDGSSGGEYGPACSIVDRDFLVAARTDVPALLDEVERLRAIIAGGGLTYSEGETALRAQLASALVDAKKLMEERDEATALANAAVIANGLCDRQRAEAEAERDRLAADYADLHGKMEAECRRLENLGSKTFAELNRHDAEQMRSYGLSYEGVRKVLVEHGQGELSFGKVMDLIRAAAKAMAEEAIDEREQCRKLYEMECERTKTLERELGKR